MLGFKYQRDIAFTTNDLAISRAGSAVLGIKYHRDIIYVLLFYVLFDFLFFCYSQNVQHLEQSPTEPRRVPQSATKPHRAPQSPT